MQASKFSHFINKNKYFRSGSRYGFAAGLFSMVAFILLFVLGENPLITNKYLDFLLIPLFVFVGVKEVRDYSNAGELHFWEGMTTGFFTYILAAILSAGFIWIFLAIDQHLVRDYIEYSTQIIMDKKEGIIEQMGMETFNTSLSNIKAIQPFDMAADDFLRKLFIGLGITTVISIAMRQTIKNNS